MARRLKPDIGLGEGIKHLLRSGLTKTIRDLGSVKTDPDTAILSARKRVKIMRANLVLIKSQRKNDHRDFKADLRTTAHGLAETRDLQAIVSIAENLARTTTRATDGTTVEAAIALCNLSVSIRQSLADYQPGEQTLVEAISRLNQWRDWIETWSLSDDPTPYFEAYQKIYHSARKRLSYGFKTSNPVEIHEGRKLVIQHRHHLVAFSRAAPDYFASRANTMRSMRRTLGDYDDLTALIDFIGSDRPQLSALTEEDRLLITQLARDTARPLAKTAEEETRLFFIEKPRPHRFNVQSLWEFATQDHVSE